MFSVGQFQVKTPEARAYNNKHVAKAKTVLKYKIFIKDIHEYRF